MAEIEILRPMVGDEGGTYIVSWLPLDTAEEGEQKCLRCLSIDEPTKGLSLPTNSPPV